VKTKNTLLDESGDIDNEQKKHRDKNKSFHLSKMLDMYDDPDFNIQRDTSGKKKY